MSSLAFFAQRALSPSERFLFLPLFMIFGIAIIAIGVNAIRSRRIGARAIESRLYGKKEWTGRMAVWKGFALCFGGVLMIITAIVLMIMGKTLLPE